MKKRKCHLRIKDILTFNKDKLIKYNKILLYLRFINDFLNFCTIILNDTYYRMKVVHV